MDHGGARNKGEKDKNEKTYFGEGWSHDLSPPIKEYLLPTDTIMGKRFAPASSIVYLSKRREVLGKVVCYPLLGWMNFP